MYSIYVHTTPEGKKYVGCTGREPIKRFGSNGSGYRCNKKFYNDILLFGWNNINHQVLETVKDKKIAIEREKYYTLLWRTNEPEFGYNIYVGNIPNEETKNKHYEKMKCGIHNKPIMIENIKTGEIHKFDSREKCAKFFGISVGPLRKFITGVRPSAFFDDYKVLK